MSHLDKDDGQTKLSRGERYSVSGYVTVQVFVRYETTREPGDDDDDLWNAIAEVVGPDFDIVDSEDLEYEIEEDGEW